MKPFEIADGIYSVGVADWNVRNFHGYSTEKGTTYNAFLLIDEKVTLIDTVRREFKDQFLKNISKIIDPKKIDCVISNHTEMDHSGSLPFLMHIIGAEKPVYCSKMGFKSLPLHFRPELNYQALENGSKLSIGKRTLQFLETRMLHWPDSMFTYLKEDKILFSSDAFGQHYAGPKRFDDEIDDLILHQAKKYYANILMLYGRKTGKLLKTVEEMGLDIKMICPDHGILWRKNPERIIRKYEKWSSQESKRKAVIVYDTMWHSTEQMAEKIAEGISDEGVEAMPLRLGRCHRSDIMTEVLDAKAVIVGSPTLNNQLYPSVSEFLTYMKGLKPRGKVGASFGSFGWSGEAVRLIRQELEEMEFEIPDPGLKIKYVPDAAGNDACYEFGRKVGKAIGK
ncbi:MAG: FprA family A-type flavoprotein [Desulfobacterales bacterium]|nr:FprA family A-type flavoprotein [Desulfobacterales bacterium]